MSESILRRVSDRLPVRVIERTDGVTYLERYYLFSFWRWRAFLHRFVSSDPEGETHDHPWTSVSFILLDKYKETRWLGGEYVEYERKWINIVKGETFHHVDLYENDARIPGIQQEVPVWTLFIHGRRFKGWGFLKQFRVSSGPDNVGFYTYTPVSRGTFSDVGWWKTAPLGRDLGRAGPRQPKDYAGV